MVGMLRRLGVVAFGLTAVVLIATGCGVSSGSSTGSNTKSAAPAAAKLNPATLGPTGIVGKGPHGEPAASMNDLKLSAADISKVKKGHFKIGIVMHTEDLDWSKLQVRGITDTLKKYGASVLGVTNAQFKVEKQISDIENMIHQKPDAIISIPVDDTATATAYKKVSQAGIKMVFMDNVPKGLQYPKDYSSMISADSQGNGQIAAKVIASRIPKGGTLGIIGFGIDFFVTNERVTGVKAWLAQNRPDIKIKQANFSKPDDAGSVAQNFLTANPTIKNVFVVWDAPAMATVAAARETGNPINVSTIDLGLEAAIEIGKGGMIKGLGAQRPYDQGVAEALAALNSLIGKQTPAWVGVQSLPVIQSNILQAYKEVWKQAPPATLARACQQSKGCGSGS
jgi:ribose transport system substrate-binding protein